MPQLYRRCSEEEQYEFDFGRPREVNYATAFEEDDGLVMRYGLDDGEINTRLGTLVSAELADLLDVAVAVYMSDRLAIRGGLARPEWRRSVALKIPVRRVDLWHRGDVQSALQEILTFLTLDEWDLTFCQRPTQFRRLSESQEHLFEHEFSGPVQVSLLSGGLDSFAGTAAAIARAPQRDYVCVSGVANYRQGDRQKEQLKRLRTLMPRSLTHVRIACRLKDAEELRQEPTRRTRGFLFLAIGAVAALAARADTLWLYENGVGALNLPFSEGELGVSTSRSVHPKTLECMEALMGLIAGSAFTIRNGSVLQTKAQMCADPLLAPVLGAIPLTFSCDAFPLRRRGATQCGVCTSCLLRRMALWNAGLGTCDAGDYRYDLCAPAVTLGLRHVRGVSEMEWQVARLAAALSKRDSWMGLVDEFPCIVLAQQALARQLGLPAAAVAEQLVGLYRRHCEEWSRFPAADSARVRKKAA